MRQIWIPRYGSPQVLELREAPDPTPQPGEVRIRVTYSGVNFADTMARMGIYPDAPPAPLVAGYEVSGRVDAVGEGVEPSWHNQRVMAITRFGGYSDVVCVPVEQVYGIPDGVTLQDAAALPVNALTAYQMLVAMGRVNPGDKVLVHGAAGGVGWAAVQMAQILGAKVFGTASSHKHDALYKLGIDHVMNYEDFETEVKHITNGAGVEVVLDSIGSKHWARSYRVLAPTGRLVMFGVSAMASGSRRNLLTLLKFGLGIPWLMFNPIKLMNDNKGVLGLNLGHMWNQVQRMQPWGEQILEWHKAGKLVPHIDSIYPFQNAAAAHRRLGERQNVGKVLLEFD